MRAAVPAVLITAALIAAVLLVLIWAPTASAAPTQVYMETENGRMVFTVASVEVGRTDTKGDTGTTTEQLTWNRLRASEEPRDTRDGPVLLADGEARGEGFTQVRIVFTDVQIARGGTLHQLAIPQDTLQVQLPEPGNAGDSLLVALDAERSVTDENGFLSFRPRVVEALWSQGGAERGEPPVRTPVAPGGGSGDPRPWGPAPVTIQTDTGGSGSVERPPAVGWMHLAFIGNGTGLVDSLDVSVSRIAVTTGTTDHTLTVQDNEANARLVRDISEEGVAEIAAIQLKPGAYTTLQFEFSYAQAGIAGTDPREASIPQPRLVLEAPFTVIQGQTMGMVVEFGVEESLRLGLQGLEFRPVIRDYHVQDSEGRDIKEPYPAQYRTDGGWLPSLGERIEDTLAEHELDPSQIPHPIHGDQDRDLRSENGLLDVDAEELEEFLNMLQEGGLEETLGGLGDSVGGGIV